MHAYLNLNIRAQKRLPNYFSLFMDHPCRINTFLHFRSSWLTFKNYTTIITVKNEKTQYFSYRFFNALCAIHFSAHPGFIPLKTQNYSSVFFIFWRFPAPTWRFASIFLMKTMIFFFSTEKMKTTQS